MTTCSAFQETSTIKEVYYQQPLFYVFFITCTVQIQYILTRHNTCTVTKARTYASKCILLVVLMETHGAQGERLATSSTKR